MILIKAENRELDALDINQPKESQPNSEEPGTGYYLALTFGTLLSSQRADAQKIHPQRAPFLAGCPTLRRFPAPPAGDVVRRPSRAARRMENSTRAARLPAGGSRPPYCAGQMPRSGAGQATPAGRNCTLTRGPTRLAVLGMQCSHVRWHEPPMTTRSPWPSGKRRLSPPPTGRSISGRGDPNETIATMVSADRPRPMRSPC